MKHRKHNNVYFFQDISRRAAFVLLPPIVLCYHVGDHVTWEGRDLFIRYFRGDMVFCVDSKTRCGDWYELYELEVDNENKVVESVFRNL